MFRNIFLGVLMATAVLSCRSGTSSSEKRPPNIIIVLTDDQGYQDMGVYGSPDIETPELDRMAEEGLRLTSFYVCASVCSPSRAGLLTGRGPSLNGVGGVFFPENKGMNASEITIAELLKPAGYRTACFGKWHLGDLEGSLPTDQGFDQYFGIPYSNDMFIGPSQTFSEKAVFREGYTLEQAKADQAFIADHLQERQLIRERGLRDKCPLFEGKKIVEYPCDQTTLTQRYFGRTINFIKESGTDPFFIYLNPAMPHIPLFAHADFEGKSRAGLYGDVVEEIDWHLGRLLRYLQETGLEKNTMVIFTSDNGPWLGKGDHAGRAHPLRNGKFTNYEGGLRVPCLLWWPGKWPAGEVSGDIISALDLFPTIAHYVGVNLPDRTLDGVNLSAHLEAPGQVAARDSLFIYRKNSIDGIRKGYWKYLPNSGARSVDENSKAELFNLRDDISETNNLVEQFPEIVKELQSAIASKKASSN